MYVLIRVLLRVKPRRGDEAGQRATLAVVNLILLGELLLFLIIQLVIIAAAFHLPIDIVFIVNSSVSVLFVLIGNYLGKLRRNRWAGIRTPWTLANDTVWERTHRLGGWLFVGIGLLGLITSFVPAMRIWLVVTMAVIVCLFLTIYSYVIFHRLETSDANPTARPHDGSNT